MLNAQQVLPESLRKLTQNDPSFDDFVTRDLALNDERMEVIGTALTTNTHLRHMSLTRHQFTRVGAAAFTNGLTQNKILQTLFIGEGDIGDSALLFGQMLCANRGMRSFQLLGALIDDEAATAFAQAIETNHKLQHLYLSQCQFTDAGLRMLIIALRKNNRIERLELNRVSLSQDNAVELAMTLRVNTGLRSLSLESCQISDASGVLIMQALVVNDTLREFILNKNQLGADTARQLALVLSGKGRLEHIALWENPIDAKLPKIERALANNRSLMAYDGRCRGAPDIPVYAKRNRAANIRSLMTLMVGHLTAKQSIFAKIPKDILFILFQEISYYRMSRADFDRLHSSISHNQTLMARGDAAPPLQMIPVEEPRRHRPVRRNGRVKLNARVDGQPNPVPEIRAHPHPRVQALRDADLLNSNGHFQARGDEVPLVAEMVPFEEESPAKHHRDLESLLEKAEAIAARMDKRFFWEGRRWNSRKKAGYIRAAITAIQDSLEHMAEATETDVILNTVTSQDDKTLSQALGYQRLFSSRQENRKKSNSLKEFEEYRDDLRRDY